jgi:hypothetical protein
MRARRSNATAGAADAINPITTRLLLSRASVRFETRRRWYWR